MAAETPELQTPAPDPFSVPWHNQPNFGGYEDDTISEHVVVPTGKDTKRQQEIPSFLGSLRPPSYIPSPFVMRQGVLAQSHQTFMLMRSSEIRLTAALRLLSDSMGTFHEDLLEPNAASFFDADPAAMSSRIPNLWLRVPDAIYTTGNAVKRRGDLEKELSLLPDLWEDYYTHNIEALRTYGTARKTPTKAATAVVSSGPPANSLTPTPAAKKLPSPEAKPKTLPSPEAKPTSIPAAKPPSVSKPKLPPPKKFPPKKL